MAMNPMTDPDSPRPLLYRMENTIPRALQPFIGRAFGQLQKQIADENDVVLIGAASGDLEDVTAAATMVKDLAGMVRGRPVILGIEAAPVGTPLPAKGVPLDADTWPASRGDGSWLAPMWDIAVNERIGLGVDGATLRQVQTKGLAKLPAAANDVYIGSDDFSRQQFVGYSVNTVGYGVYAERVIARKYEQLYANDTDAPKQENYISSTILQHEAAAKAIADKLRSMDLSNDNKRPLVIALVAEDHLKFGHGIQGRLERLRIGTAPAEKDGPPIPRFPAVTSILCNPTAASTFSLTTRIRMTISALPEEEPRALADFLWFGSSPPPNLITRMMNPIDGNFKIDLGLSTGGTAEKQF